jgi:hypothetical protein
MKEAANWAALLIDLAELLFQFGNQRFQALACQIIRRPRKPAGFHDLHFEFHTLVLGGHS